MTASAFQSKGSTSLACTTASARVAIPGGVANRRVAIYNPTTAIMFVDSGDNTVVAASDGTDFAIPPGQQRLITVNQDATHVALILSAGSGTAYISAGTGGI